MNFGFFERGQFDILDFDRFDFDPKKYDLILRALKAYLKVEDNKDADFVI